MTKPNRVQKRKNIRPSRTRRTDRSEPQITSLKPLARGSKQTSVLKLLSRPGGTTVADIVKATG